jgi:two-component system, NarL family, response regulator LiaR
MNDRASSAGRLLITDDHAMVREGIRTMLASEPDLEVVGEAENGQEALKCCRSLSPDLVLMDVRMPEMDGLEATRAIKKERPQTSVLMVTTHDSPDYLLDAIKAGAVGYVLKDSTRQQLLSAVRRALSNEFPLNETLAMRLLKRLADEVQSSTEPLPKAKRRQEPLPESPAESLTTQELKVLRELARGKTNGEVAQALQISLSTAKTYVGHIIAKLGVSDRTQAAVRAVELGLLAEQEEQ